MQQRLARAAAKEKARAEAEQKRKAEEEKRLAAQAKKQAAEEQQRRQQEERQRRADTEKAEKAAQAQRLAAAKTQSKAEAKPAVAKPTAPQSVASKAVVAAVSADEVTELWDEAKEDSAPIATYPVEDKLLSDRNRDIVESLEPVCKAILDNDASVVIHTENKADYRWLTVRLTLCLRRMDTTFRLRHSFESVADNNPFVTLHPSRETSLVRQSSD